MSTYGIYSLQLRRERLARLRLEQEHRRREQVRQEARRLLADVRQAMGRSQHHLAEHFARKAQQESRDLTQQAERLLRSDPDRALQTARRGLAAAQRGLEQASEKMATWSRQKVKAQEAVTLLRLSLEGLCRDGCIKGVDNPLLAEAVGCLAEAAASMRREDFIAAVAAAQKGLETVGQAEKARHQQQESEAIRREIVRGLRQVLSEMNFAVERPRLSGGANDGTVVLVGKLPSGRAARFEIFLDGQVHYDFEGYQGRQCGKDEEAVRRQLEALLDAKATCKQRHWKSPPLQISSNALDPPSSVGGQLHR